MRSDIKHSLTKSVNRVFLEKLMVAQQVVKHMPRSESKFRYLISQKPAAGACAEPD